MSQASTRTNHRIEIESLMKGEGIPDLAIRTFLFYYEQLLEGRTGLTSESDILPVDALPDAEALGEHYRRQGEEALGQTILLKLNGGLGTGMGLQDAKSLLPVRDDQTFLDIIARQAVYRSVPLVLMNSFSTAASSQKRLALHKSLSQNIPFDFLQHKTPKIERAAYRPVRWPANPDLEWCPPGHGDIYTALTTTGMLRRFLDAGYLYAFVSNSDNLGAIIDTALLGYFSDANLPFMMEVADRTFADRKGGHLARTPDGQFVLRESAQCPAEEMPAFQNIERYKYFNTNNLWIRLDALHALLEANDGIMGLPMIRNTKTVDPRDNASTPVYQLETAMGAAIGVFKGAGAIRVPRSRFAPVKTTNELLAVRSDACVLNDDHTLTLHPERHNAPCVIDLDRTYFKTVDQLGERFPGGPPSLLHCDALYVEGDVCFGTGIQCIGRVHISNESDRQVVIEDGSKLEGVITFE